MDPRYDTLRKHIKDMNPMFLILGLYSLFLGPQIALQVWRNNHIRELPEGYNVREIDKERVFYLGNGRFGLDRESDGILDRTLINMPFGPFQGGPGVMPYEVVTTTDDLRRFERANCLLKQEQNNRERK